VAGDGAVVVGDSNDPGPVTGTEFAESEGESVFRRRERWQKAAVRNGGKGGVGEGLGGRRERGSLCVPRRSVAWTRIFQDTNRGRKRKRINTGGRVHAAEDGRRRTVDSEEGTHL